MRFTPLLVPPANGIAFASASHAMVLVAAILMIPIQISTTVSLQKPTGDAHYVVLLRWPGEPRDVSLNHLPTPEVSNLELVGVSVRRRTGRGQTTMEIRYRYRPTGVGRGRIAATRFSCDVGGRVKSLAAEPVGFEIPASGPTAVGRLYWLLLLMPLLGAGIWYGFSRRRAGEPPSPVDWHQRLAAQDIVGLVATARQHGLAVPPLVAQACKAFKFGREDPDEELVRRFRTDLTRSLRDHAEPDRG